MVSIIIVILPCSDHFLNTLPLRAEQLFCGLLDFELTSKLISLQFTDEILNTFCFFIQLGFESFIFSVRSEEVLLIVSARCLCIIEFDFTSRRNIQEITIHILLIMGFVAHPSFEFLDVFNFFEPEVETANYRLEPIEVLE